ncbi:hypothetical protein HK104_004726 [Borealophlyctis nickersoniae]|nr:hypothetical protein HK104_004726 [Borealophlyctis nickersoniae]
MRQTNSRPPHLLIRSFFSRRLTIVATATVLLAAPILIWALARQIDATSESTPWQSPQFTHANQSRQRKHIAIDETFTTDNIDPDAQWVPHPHPYSVHRPYINTTLFDNAYASYIAQHATTLHQKHKKDKQYLVVRTPMQVGLGNRLSSIITGLYLGMIMNRTVLIRWHGFEKLFHPVGTTSVVYYNEYGALRWSVKNTNMTGIESKPFRPYKRSSGYSSPGVYELLGGDLNQMMKGNLTSPTHITQRPVMTFYSFDYDAPMLQVNPSTRPWFESTFGPGLDGSFYAAARKFLRPHPNIVKEARSFARARFGKFNVGVQIRTKKRGKTVPSVKTFCEVARMVAASAGIGGGDEGDVRFFIATDAPDLFPEIEELLGHDRVIYVPDPGMYLSKIGATVNPGFDRSAVLDMTLLSMCDAMVVTFGSSFGQVAAAMGGIRVVTVMHGTGGKKERVGGNDPYFWGATSVEPCFYKGSNIMGYSGGRRDLQSLWKTHPLWMHYAQCHWHY